MRQSAGSGSGLVELKLVELLSARYSCRSGRARPGLRLSSGCVRVVLELRVPDMSCRSGRARPGMGMRMRSGLRLGVPDIEVKVEIKIGIGIEIEIINNV